MQHTVAILEAQKVQLRDESDGSTGSHGNAPHPLRNGRRGAQCAGPRLDNQARPKAGSAPAAVHLYGSNEFELRSRRDGSIHHSTSAPSLGDPPLQHSSFRARCSDDDIDDCCHRSVDNWSEGLIARRLEQAHPLQLRRSLDNESPVSHALHPKFGSGRLSLGSQPDLYAFEAQLSSGLSKILCSSKAYAPANWNLGGVGLGEICC